jgi:hypothetical protein
MPRYNAFFLVLIAESPLTLKAYSFKDVIALDGFTPPKVSWPLVTEFSHHPLSPFRNSFL